MTPPTICGVLFWSVFEGSEPLPPPVLPLSPVRIPALFMFWLLKQSGGQISGMLNKKKFNWTAAKKVPTLLRSKFDGFPMQLST